MDRTDRSVFVVFGSVSVRFGPSSFLSQSGPTPSPKLSVLHIGPNRTETEPMLSIPGKHQVYRVWCGLHQLDLVLKHAYTELWENEVVEVMKKFIAHLRQQPRLIADMKATCPQLTTRWLIMGNVCRWLLAKRLELFDHINTAEKP